jgi:hypothetical protein
MTGSGTGAQTGSTLVGAGAFWAATPSTPQLRVEGSGEVGGVRQLSEAKAARLAPERDIPV